MTAKQPVGYHINAEQKVLPCHAEYGCPLKDHNGFPAQHFSDEIQATAKNRADLSSEFDPLRPVGAEKPLVRRHVQAAVLWNKEFNRLSELQTELLSTGEPLNYELDEAIRQAKAARKEFYDKISDTEWYDTDAPRYKDRPVTVKGLEFTATEPRIGLYNLEKTDELDAYQKPLHEASNQWLSRLSTAELKAVFNYKNDSTYYAMGVAEKEEVSYLHSALEKAPKLKEPITVYSTVNEYKVDDVLLQLESGTLRFDKSQSSSINPYVASTFIDTYGEKPVVTLEFKTKSAAVASGLGSFEHEMEVIVPPGNYRVTKVLRDVQYGAANPVAQSGTAAYTLIVEEVEDE